MVEASKNPLLVESLNARHISMLSSTKPAKRLRWLELMVFNSWLAQIESNLSRWLPRTKPLSFLALEKQLPISLLIVTPNNRRGSCLSIQFPELISNPKEASVKDIRKVLMDAAIEKEAKTAQSWLIRCPVNDLSQIATLRELGFQPLKLFNSWSPISKSNLNVKVNTTYHDDLKWVDVNNSNVELLWSLEKRSESSQLRQILDRQLKDLLQNNNSYNRILLAERDGNNTAIAGLVFREFSENFIRLELLRDCVWDERLTPIISNIPIEKYNNNNQEVIIETSKEDEHLSELLIRNGWIFKFEAILLGRSIWRRQDNRKKINSTKQIKSMLKNLGPQTPPLPTPSLEHR